MLNSFSSCDKVLVDSLGFSVHKIMLFAKKKLFYFLLSTLNAFVSLD